MKDINLNDISNIVKDCGSYFITVTTKDKKLENNLNHYVFRKEFENDDIVPSLDECVRSLDVKLQPLVPIIKPKMIDGYIKPLKIAIITHFNRAPESYSPARAVKNQVKILMEYGHEVVFFVTEGSKLDLGCTMKPVIPRFKRIKGVVDQEAKTKIIDVLKRELTPDFDIAITHDFYIRDTITYREAIKECGIDIEWLHFARSGVAEYLNWDMPNARYVYLNSSDARHFADHVGINYDKVRVVPNEKEIFYMFDFHPITRMIINKYKLWDKDIIMTLPVCSTRLDAKGINSIIKVFVELKRLGKRVILIVANSNGRRRVDDLKRKQEMAKKFGLNEDEFVFTSLLANDEYDIASEVPNRVCAELMQVSNLMIMATIAEVSSNILLEASVTKQLLVLNSDLPCLFDAVDENMVLKYPFSSSKNLHYTGRDDKSINKLAVAIINNIDNNKADKMFRHVWKNYNSYSLYHNILKPILYERMK